MQIERKKS